MLKRCGLVSGVAVATEGTSISGIAAVCAIGLGNYCVIVMLKRINGHGGAGNLNAAHLTIRYVVVAARAAAGGQYVIFLNRLFGGMVGMVSHSVTRAGYLVEADGILIDVGGDVNSEHLCADAAEVEGEILCAPSARGHNSMCGILFSGNVEHGGPLAV